MTTAEYNTTATNSVNPIVPATLPVAAKIVTPPVTPPVLPAAIPVAAKRVTKPRAAPVKAAVKAPVTMAKAKVAVKAPAVKAAVKAPAAVKAKVVAKPKAEKPAKVKKPKLVRDSFTIPKVEYTVLEDLKQRAGKLASSVKKSEFIRAGIKALAAMSDHAFLAALKAVPTIKTGRPSKAKSD